MVNLKKLKQSLSLPRRTLNVLIILATLVAAVYYFYKHHSLLGDLKHISPFVALEVFGLYLVMLGVLVMIYTATMKLVKIHMPLKENSLINAYSLFMNFFIPGQTGPAFRAYYMKKNHKLKYLDYTISTIIYYLIYGVLSVIFVIAGSQPYYLTLPAIVVIIALAALGLWLYLKKNKQARLDLNVRNVVLLVGATLAQLIVQAIIYAVEVHSVKSGVHLSQMVTYTGTANLALFVALTPGAIGIREGFLILTERLNHLSSSTIVLANVVDRSVYIIFLLILGVVIAALKVKEKLGTEREVK